MPTYISTVKFTARGLQGIQDTSKRATTFKAAAKKMGVKVVDIYWTLGNFDGLIIFDAKDDETAAAATLHLSAQGNVHTTTARAFNAAEMDKIVGRLPK